MELIESGALDYEDLSHRYLWGPEVDQLLVDEVINDVMDSDESDLLWALTEHLNTPRDVVQYDDGTSTTKLVAHLSFESSGNLLETVDDTGSPLSERPIEIGCTGRLFDESTSLQYNLNRWYDAPTGEWLSQDPIGFEAADANLHRYV